MSIAPPTLVGFQSFLLKPMGITADILPPTDPVVEMAYDIAIDIVNLQLNVASPDIYTLAVYNLAGSNIINYAQDQVYTKATAPPGSTLLPDGTLLYLNNLPFFAYTRHSFGTLGIAQGVIQSSSDVSTSESMVVPEWAKELTMADLQYRKDPWGAHYLALAQRYGTIWGLN
jgi:hypothetical protein